MPISNINGGDVGNSSNPTNPSPNPNDINGGSEVEGSWGGYGPSGGMLASASDSSFTANPQDYANNLNQANKSAQNYYNQGANWQQATPQAVNGDAASSQTQLGRILHGQHSLGQQLQAAANNGQNSQASQQYLAGVRQSMQAQTALGNSTGGGLAAAGARRGAVEQNAAIKAGSQAGGVATAAQAQSNAQNQLGVLLGQQGSLQNQRLGAENSLAASNAQLVQQQGSLNNAAQLGLYGLSANEQSLGVGALTGYSNTLLGEAGASNEEQQVNNAFGNTVAGAAAQGTAGVMNGLAQSYQKQQNANTGN